LGTERADVGKATLVSQAANEVNTELGVVQIALEIEEVRFDAEAGADGGSYPDVRDTRRERAWTLGAEPVDETGVDAVGRKRLRNGT
jgi:hypothetical protein